MSTAANPEPRLEFFSDPAGFLAAASDYLAAEPVISNVVTSVTHRMLSRQADGIAQPDRDWWLVVTEESGAIVGAGMRTAPFAPYPLFLLPMPDAAAVALARALHERGEEVLAVNGALPAARLCADELARLDGGEVQVSRHIARGCAYSLTRQTRPRTRSTPPSATSPWPTWPTSSSSDDRRRRIPPSAAVQSPEFGYRPRWVVFQTDAPCPIRHA